MSKKKQSKSWWRQYKERLEQRHEDMQRSRLTKEERERRRLDERERQNRSRLLYPSPVDAGSKSGGWRGRLVMQVGGSGPRGSRFPRVTHQRPPRSVIIKSKYIANTKYAKRRLGIWLNYCVKDKKYEQDKGAEKLPAELLREKEFFTKNKEGLNKEEASLLIESNFGRRAAYHQMILSSGDRDVEPQVYARLQMDALERRLGHKLTWVANVHRDTGPDKVHINITIAGSIPDQQKIKRGLPYKGKDIDHERLSAEDKFLSSDGQWYTKYHPQQELKSHSRWLKRDDARQIDGTTYKKKLWRWIGAKEHQGDDCYGTPPLKDLEKEQELGGYRPRSKRGEPDGAQPEQAKEQKQLEKHFASETDRIAHELTGGKIRSPQGVRYTSEANRAASIVENELKQRQLKTSWNNRGDVYIDRESLNAMRAHGNYYVYMQRNFDREIELAIERELGDRGRDREHERETRTQTRRSLDPERRNIGKEQFKQDAPGTKPDNIRDGSRDERQRKRGDDEDGSRGRS